MNQGADKYYMVDPDNLKEQPNFLQTMFDEKTVPESILVKQSKMVQI